MGAAPHRHDADAELARHRHRLLDGAHADHEAKGVLTVERSRNRRYALRRERRPRIDQASPQPVEVAGKAADAVSVDAAQVGADEARGDRGGIVLRQTVRQEKLSDECVRRLGCDIDALGSGGLW